MKGKLPIIGLALGILLLLSITSSVALHVSQAPAVSKQVSTDSLIVKLTGGGNVPMYQFWSPNDNNTKYKVQFNQVFEAKDSASGGTNGSYDLGTDSKVPGQTLALSKLSWNFSPLQTKSNGDVNFNLTSSDGTFQFRNHLSANASSLKFDVVIKNYQFKSQDSMLVLGFKIQVASGSSDNAANTNQDGNSVKFDNGFFQSTDTATAGNSSVHVGMSTGSDSGSIIYLAYGNFAGTTLVHDPTIGVSDSAQSLLGSNYLFISIIALFVPVAIYRRKMHKN